MSSDYATAPVLFGKWSYEDLEVDDLALADYIAAVNTSHHSSTTTATTA